MKTVDWDKLAYELLKQAETAFRQAQATSNDDAKTSYFAAGVTLSGISQALKTSIKEEALDLLHLPTKEPKT